MDDSTNSTTIKLVVFLIFIMGLLLTINPALATGETYEPNLRQSTTTGTFHPAGPTEYKLFIDGVTKPNHDTQRRRLAPYQLCLPCKCCSATTCISMPCCFGIDCQLPNKPFGVCAFVPKTCNCANCTTPA
ncbi:uncharacterized protein LOC108868150 [Pyrus x bretschneideri]|uniref:uncharacterized protein LOC108868150 n=1 Tax=Pyrus x bretschneideri TaxID=225117 RepID=UPI0008706A18|nr:uncharacterized protein LOC108868150 [Pyrus x bretschneideri]